MSSFPRPCLPKGSDPTLAAAYRQSYELAMARLYNPDLCLQVGRVSDPEDLPLSHQQSESSFYQFHTERRDRELLDDLGFTTKIDFTSEDTKQWTIDFSTACLKMGKPYAVNLVTYFYLAPYVEKSQFNATPQTHEWVLKETLVTAVYVPSAHTGKITAHFAGHVVTRSSQEPDQGTLRDPSQGTLWGPPSTDEIETLLERALSFWNNADQLAARFDACTPTVEHKRPVFDRSESFWVGDEEYVRWVPFHPFLPCHGEKLIVTLWESNLPAPRFCVETVHVANPDDDPVLQPDVCVVADGLFEPIQLKQHRRLPFMGC